MNRPKSCPDSRSAFCQDMRAAVASMALSHCVGGAIAVNRLVTAGAVPSWLPTQVESNGFRFAPGSLVVPYLKAAEPAIAGIARDLGLRVDGAKGKAPANLRSIGRSRVALYKPWLDSVDEGWTRWVLEQYEFTFASLTDAVMRAGSLRASYDVIILPSVPMDRLVAGLPADAAPAEFVGGLGPLGVESIKAFVRAGGTLVCLGQSTALGISSFDLPIQNVALDNDRIFVPGSILTIDLDTSQPLGYGMEASTHAFFAFSAAFDAPSDVTTVARYASHDLLLSGWLEGESLLAGRAAAIDAAVEAGRVVLFGFPVQHRGQSLATFRLLFNALIDGPAAPALAKAK